METGLTLYHEELSPCCKSVLLTAEALNIKLKLHEVNTLKKEQHKPEFLKKNILHTLPVLEDEQGTIIVDSHAIMAYLVSKFGKTDELYPKDLLKRALVDQYLYFDIGTLFNTGTSYMKRKWAGEKYLPDHEKDYFLEQYSCIEHYLSKNNSYMCGDTLTICDFSISTTLKPLMFIVPLDEKVYPKTNAWLKRIEYLSYYKKIMETFLQNFAELLN